MNTVKNPREFKDLILRRLGAPIIQIEVTEDHVFDSIGRALELYKEYHYDALNKAYITVKMTEEQAATGIIDLSEYPIFSVNKIVRAQASMFGALGGGTSLNFFTDFLRTLAGGPAGCSYHGPFGMIGNIGYFAQLRSYQNLLQDQLDPIPDYWYDSNNGVLQITGAFREGDIHVLEVYIQNFMDFDERAMVGIAGAGFAGGPTAAPSSTDVWNNPYKRLKQGVAGMYRKEFPDQGVYNVRWVKDMATAFTKEIWGEVLAKHQGMQLPGGVTIDGERLINEAREEQIRLREELMLLVDDYSPILMG